MAAGAVADAARWGTSAYVDLSSFGALEYGRGRRAGGGVVAQCDDFALFVGADGLFAVTGDVVVAVDACVGGVRGGVRGGVWVDVPGDRTLSGPTLVAVEGLDFPPPRSAAGGVFEDDACFQELRANGVGAGEVARLLGGAALVHQRLDACIVVTGGTAPEPVGRRLLQQAERGQVPAGATIAITVTGNAISLLGDSAAFDAASARSATLSAEMHAFRDGENTRRVYQAIRSRGVPAPKGAA